MPKGFITHDGPKPEFAELFGITEHLKSTYAPRTFDNVKNSDATLRFAINFDSPGELCTLKAIKQYNKPYLDIKLKNDDNVIPTHNSIEFVVHWIATHNFKIINIAGNSNKTHPKMQEKVRNFMKEVLVKLKE